MTQNFVILLAVCAVIVSVIGGTAIIVAVIR